jgi:hypothetical protein
VHDPFDNGVSDELLIILNGRRVGHSHDGGGSPLSLPQALSRFKVLIHRKRHYWRSRREGIPL